MNLAVDGVAVCVDVDDVERVEVVVFGFGVKSDILDIALDEGWGVYGVVVGVV